MKVTDMDAQEGRQEPNGAQAAQVDPDAGTGAQIGVHGLDRIDAFIRSVVYAAGNATRDDFALAPPAKEDS